jgi:hypothetical protein
MELESSSPYPQVPAICPYPEPTPSSHSSTYYKLQMGEKYCILEALSLKKKHPVVFD